MPEWSPETIAADDLAHLRLHTASPLEVERHVKRLIEEFGVTNIAELVDRFSCRSGGRVGWPQEDALMSCVRRNSVSVTRMGPPKSAANGSEVASEVGASPGAQFRRSRVAPFRTTLSL